MTTCIRFLAICLLLLSWSRAAAALTIDESVIGDLSNDRLAPSFFTLELGTNSLIATSISGDREYVALEVPAGMTLDSMVLVDYIGGDPIAFVGIQSGAQFTEPPVGTAIFRLLGYTHFGPGADNVGTDVLDDLGLGAGASGFTPPLPAGTYSFWIQQTGTAPTDYHFELTLVPEPSLALLLLASGTAAFWAMRIAYAR